MGEKKKGPQKQGTAMGLARAGGRAGHGLSDCDLLSLVKKRRGSCVISLAVMQRG